MRFLELLALLTSAALTFFLNVKKIPIATYQQIIIFLLLLSLIGYNQFMKTNKILPHKLTGIVALFLSSFFVQLLIVSTGGVFSPFIIMVHLFALSVSFLVNIQTSIAFLILVVGLLGHHTLTNANELKLIQDDPGTVLLYGASLLVIIPLSQIISKKYHLKEELARILERQVEIGGSILESLSELVLVTDTNLKIILTNDATKKALGGDILGKNLIETLDLEDQSGQKATLSSLSVDKTLVDKTTRIVNNFLLYTSDKTTPRKVTIRIRPIIDTSGKVDQLSIVITEATTGVDTRHTGLAKAEADLALRFSSLKAQLKQARFTNLQTQLELIIKSEKDLLLTQELEDHRIKENMKLTDVALITKQAVEQKLPLAQNLRVNLKFILEEEYAKENSAISLQQSNSSLVKTTVSEFAVPMDEKWLAVYIEKVLDLAILLSSGTKNPTVSITPAIKDSKVNITTQASSPALLDQEKKFLFEQYFGPLAKKTNLRFGSGLEGFIIKIISTQLNIPLQVELNPNSLQIKLIISVPQKPRT